MKGKVVRERFVLCIRVREVYYYRCISSPALYIGCRYIVGILYL